MPSDADYLAEAGIDVEGNPVEPQAEQAAPNAETQTTQQAIEELLFEAGGRQFKVPANAELSLKHAGQMVRKPVSSIINGWRQVGDYNQKLAEIDKRNKEFDSRQTELDKYAQLQKWSEDNPDLFNWVWSNYENRDKLGLQHQLGMVGQPQGTEQKPGSATISPQVLEVLNSMKQELGGLREWKSSWEKQQEEAQTEQDIQLIDEQIGEFQKYLDSNFAQAGIKLDSVDEDGLSLQAKIIKYGIDAKLPDFDTAALKYLKDTLVKTAQQQGSSNAVKNIQAQTRNGVIARSNKPFSDGQELRPDNVQNKGYDQLGSEAKQELAELLNS